MSNDNTLSQITPLLNCINFSCCGNVIKDYTVLPIKFCFKCIFTVLSSLCRTYRKIETLATVISYKSVRHHCHKIKAGRTQRYIVRNILYMLYVIFHFILYFSISKWKQYYKELDIFSANFCGTFTWKHEKTLIWGKWAFGIPVFLSKGGLRLHPGNGGMFLYECTIISRRSSGLSFQTGKTRWKALRSW